MTPDIGQSMLHSFVGMPGDGVSVVSDYDAALARGPVEQGRIAETTLGDLEIVTECATAVDLANQIKFLPW